ncbi:MAG: hypothetical protein Q9201_002551 [Fulgogasparrea decipioides]
MRTVSIRKERRHDPMTRSGRNSRRQRASREARHAETSRINACSGTNHQGTQCEQQDQDTQMTIGLPASNVAQAISTSKHSPRANLLERSEEDAAMIVDFPQTNEAQAASISVNTPAGAQELHDVNMRILSEVNLEAVAPAACSLPPGRTQAQPGAKYTDYSLHEIIEEARYRRSLNVVAPTPSSPPVTTAKRIRFSDKLVREEGAGYNEPEKSGRAPLSQIPGAPTLPQVEAGDTGSQMAVDQKEEKMEGSADKENVYFRVPKKKNCRAKMSWPNGVDAAPLIQWVSSSPPPCPDPPPNSPTPPSPIVLPLEPTDVRPALVLEPPSSDDEGNCCQNPKVHVFPPKRSATLVPRDEVWAERIERARLKRMEREKEREKWERVREEMEREDEELESRERKEKERRETRIA